MFNRIFTLLLLVVGSSGWLACETDEGDIKDAADGSPDGLVDTDTKTDTDDSEPWSEEKYLTVKQIYERFVAGDSEMLLLYVIDEEFYDLGMIEGSLVIPWDLLPQNLDQVDPARRVAIYCRHGVRSESAYETLTAAGYKLVWIMDGGIVAWREAGYPVIPVS